MLRKMFGHKTKVERRGWKMEHNENFHDMLSSPNIKWMPKSRRKKIVDYVANVGKCNICRFLVGKPKEKTSFQRHVYGRREQYIGTSGRNMSRVVEWIYQEQNKNKTICCGFRTIEFHQSK